MRAEPSRAEPSRAEPSRAEPSRAEPSVGYCLSSTSPPEFSAAPAPARPSDAPSPSGRVRHTRSAAPAGARDRDRARRPARPGRTAVLVLGLLLLGAAAAEAQTTRTLVSNQGQTADDSANTSGNDHAQLFHTGANAAGYTFTGMHVSSEDTEGDAFDVEICEADTTANEFPTTTCTALTAPATFSGNVIFTHTGLALAANTNYVVVVLQRGTGSVELDSTTSSGEDATGLSDWSIKNKFYWQSGGSTWNLKSGSNEALSIIVRGYLGAPVDTTDATLSALSVSGATLSPAFAAIQTSYHAVVANAVTQATITETTSEATATVEYLDNSDATLTDADTTTAGLQVNLNVGSNIVKVKVTAPDTTTTETYTVEVFRAAVPVACSPASMTNRIWTGNLTAGTRLGGGTTIGFAPFSGALDNTTFSYNSNAYSIDAVTVDGFGIFGFSLGTATLGTDANDLILHLGTEPFALADADAYNSANNNYSFYSNVPSWADGDAACLALTVVGPAVSSVALTSTYTADAYGINEFVEATVTFSAAVDITGTPQLELDFDGTAKAAACATGTNTTTMVCSYKVVESDSAPNGVAIAANKLTGGTITATGSTTISADLTHGAVAIDDDHKVDGIRPTLVTTGADAPTTSTDGAKVILTFSETISSADQNDITLQANGVTVTTTAASVAGTRVDLDLTTALTATDTNLTVALAAAAGDDAAGNGNLALAATAVTNAVVANEPPEFSSPTATREVPENTAANTNIGTALPAATDADNDPLTYTLEDADAASFDFDPATRQLSTKSGVTYDHETKPSYSVTLKAEDDNGGSGTLAVTIDLTDVEEPPDRPAAPSVSSVDGNTTSLEVNWTAPSNTGPAIDDYDLRYREGSSGSWTNGPQNVSGTSATIGSLTESTSYQVQVLARNAEGDSPWSLARFGADRRAGGARRAAQPRCHARQRASDAQLGPALRRRGGHRLRIRAGRFRDLDLHGQHGHPPHGDRPEQRPDLHVPGASGERPGQWCCGHAASHAISANRRRWRRWPAHNGAVRAQESAGGGWRRAGNADLGGAGGRRGFRDHRLRGPDRREGTLDLHRLHRHHPYGHRTRQRPGLCLPGAGGQPQPQGPRFQPGRGGTEDAGGSGLRAFRQWDRHHLRDGARERGHTSDPAHPLLLRSGGPAHGSRIGGGSHGRSGSHRGRQPEHLDGDGTPGRTHDFDPRPGRVGVGIGEGGLGRSHRRVPAL